MKKTFLTSVLSATLLMAMGVTLVSAQSSNDVKTQSNVDVRTKTSNTNISILNPFKDSIGTSLPKLFQTLLEDVLLPLGGILCVFAFIFAGFKYVTAQGNETQIKDANRALLYAAIGTAVLLGSWVIAKAICSTIAQLGGPACPA